MSSKTFEELDVREALINMRHDGLPSALRIHDQAVDIDLRTVKDPIYREQLKKIRTLTGELVTVLRAVR